MSKKKDKIPDGPFAKLNELKKKLAAEEEAAKTKPKAPEGRAAPKPLPAAASRASYDVYPKTASAGDHEAVLD